MTIATAVSAAHCLADQDLRVLGCDQAFLDLLGRPRADVIGRRKLDFTHPLDRGLNRTMFSQLAEAGTAFSITKRYVRGDGVPLWVSTCVAPVMDGIGPMRVSATSIRVERPVSRLALDRNLVAARRLCKAFVLGKDLFGAELFSAPAAEILLRLYAAELDGTCLTGEALAEGLRISGNAAVRWLTMLQQRELIEVESDETASAAAAYRIAKHCEMALDSLILSAGF